MVKGLSLANKSQLLFGFAVLVILTAVLSVPWIREQIIVRESQMDVARQLAQAWLDDQIQLGTLRRPKDRDATLRMAVVFVDEIDSTNDDTEPFVQAAYRRFLDSEDVIEHVATANVDGRTVYRYARTLRAREMQAIRDRALTSYHAAMLDPLVANPLRAILVIERRSEFAESQLLLSQVYIIAAGVIGMLLAVLVFYFILTKLIFSPVRKLRKTTDLVQSGDLTARSQIRTGDEFEHLAEAFNAMLDRVAASQQQLRSMNESLDLKLNELAEANVGLFESNRLKSEFLANVSHELKTPLNSIIGFTELLDEMAGTDPEADPKRRRYLGNILTSGRQLLDMISELLNMAKIEAGRMEVVVEPASIEDLVEGLVAIMRPQAEAKSITLDTRIAAGVPTIETDPGKLQQILYNFLSNAVKFSPVEGTITITASRLTRQDNSPGVRIAVADEGPGIPPDMQDTIFEKFRQVDASHTREHSGTGLGLAICRELADMLGATVTLVSQPGHGATFCVDLPMHHQTKQAQPLMGDLKDWPG
ncbi:MAG: HAMP domain-containing histidine kinase [Phycisphaerales bacterium]|nr:HAMP domain-containing histidine kinase [Phycisphaerales bacterium]